MGFTDNYTKKISLNSTTTTSGATVRKYSGANAATLAAQTFPINFCDDGDDDDDNDNPNGKRAPLIPDQEILDSIEEIYFEANADIGIYELNVSKI